jgi:bile acid:Na+ symporter, BASS family
MKVPIEIVVPAMTFILLAAVGLDLTAADFAHVRRQLVVVLAGLVAPLVLLPSIAVGLTRLFQASPEITAGLLIITACPIGGISNTYSYLARASTALSVTLTGLSCVCASVTIPLVGKGFEMALAQPFPLSVPIPLLVGQLVLVLGLPVAVGMWVRRRAPDLAERAHLVLRRLAFLGIGVVLLLVIVDDPLAFAGGLWTTVPMAAVFVVSSMGAGWMTATLVTRDSRDRFTLAVEFGTRNVAVATTIAVALLGRVDFARFAATYFLTEIPLMLVAVALFRHRQALIGARRAASST